MKYASQYRKFRKGRSLRKAYTKTRASVAAYKRRRRTLNRRVSRVTKSQEIVKKTIGSYPIVVKTSAMNPGFVNLDVGKTRVDKRFLAINKQLFSQARCQLLNETYNIGNMGNTAESTMFAMPAMDINQMDQVQYGIQNTYTTTENEVYAYINSCTSSYKLINNHSQNCQATFWICWPRKDLYFSNEARVLGVDPSLFVYGIQSASQENKTLPMSSADYDITPFFSPAWCRYFKCKQIHNQYMRPGDMITVNVSLPKAFKFSFAQFGLQDDEVMSQRYSHLKRLGPVVLCRIQGTPVHDESKTSSGTVPTTDITSSYYNVDVIRTGRTSYYGMTSQQLRKVGRIGYALPAEMPIASAYQFGVAHAEFPAAV